MDVTKNAFIPVEPTQDVDIDIHSGMQYSVFKELFRCTNKDCFCITIQREYNFCPLCGFPINWIDNKSESECHDGDTTIEEDEDE